MRTLLAILALLLAAATIFAADAPARLPVPEEAKLTEASALVRDIFKAEYAQSSPEKRKALAEKMVAEGKKTADDPAAQFVLFRIARDIATAASDFETALAAIDELERTFDYRGGDADRAGIFTKAVVQAKSPELVQKIAEECLAMARRAIAADQFDQATSHLGIVDQAARRLKSVPLAGTVRQLRTDVAAAREQFAKIAKHAETLKRRARTIRRRTSSSASTTPFAKAIGSKASRSSPRGATPRSRPLARNRRSRTSRPPSGISSPAAGGPRRKRSPASSATPSGSMRRTSIAAWSMG